MFQSVTAERPARRFTFRFALASGAVHVLVGVAFLVSAWWEISELNRPTRHSVAGVAMPKLGGSSPADASTAKRVKPKKKRLAKDLVQPSATKPDPANVAAAAADDSTGSGDGQGEGPGDSAGTGSGPGGPIGSITGCLDLSKCGTGIADLPSIEEEEERPTQVAPDVLSSLTRISGDPQIQPPSSTKNAMHRQGESRVVAVLKVCLDRGGSVDSVRVAKSSGHTEYDAKLKSKIRTWRYQPYRVSGKALAICSHIQFIYEQQ